MGSRVRARGRLLMMIKGVCVASMAFQEVDQGITLRALDLVRGALSPAASAQPLRGRTITIEDFERAHGRLAAKSA